MKVIAVVLLCALVAIESRNTAAFNARTTLSALGENPWFVHLRLSTFTSGALETCAGSLISANWILTSASCAGRSQWVWSRYGVVNVVNPSFVTETANFVSHPNYNPVTGDNDIGLIDTRRTIESTANVAPVHLPAAGAQLPSSGKFCSFGANENGSPGDFLTCKEFANLADISAPKFDTGAPLVVDGVQYGIVTHHLGNTNVVNVADYISWIEQVSGLTAAELQGRQGTL